AAELRREPTPDGFDVAVDQTAVIDGILVLVIEVALERVLHDARRRAVVTVVQVDQRAIGRVRLLDLTPIGFVGGDLFRRTIGDGRRGGRDLLEAVRVHRQRGRADDTA